LVKDQLNLLVKEKLKIDQHLNELVLKNTLTNFRNLISNNYDYRLNYINDLNFYLDRLTAIEPSHNLLDLALNKLRINKEFFCDKTQK